jgi:precorrin-2/cobalt-factor-2 C20-methyltransferase
VTRTGTFFGIGVGPGEPGLIPVAAWNTLKKCQVIFVPRASTTKHSVARRCLPTDEIPQHHFREVEFSLEADREVLSAHYAELAEIIAKELCAGQDVAYLTLGDPLTYSTYIYTLAALRDRLPDLRHRTFPGVTSYCAVAAAAGFALGEGKQHILILPCPARMEELRSMIETHDTVVLMKIGDRLPAVLDLLRQMGIAHHCVFGSRIGMADEVLYANVAEMDPEKTRGYLSTLLIRKNAIEKRCPGAER